MKIRKLPFTLIEILIGISLTTLIMGMIFAALYQQVTLKSKLEKEEAFIMSKAYFQQRLNKIFSNIEHPIILTNKNVLEIKYDNGIDPELPFCDHVKGSIYLKNENVILDTQGEELHRIEILKRNVKTIKYHFLTIEKDEVVEKKTWNKEANAAPLYIKITLNKNESYAFWINTPPPGIPIKKGEPT